MLTIVLNLKAPFMFSSCFLKSDVYVHPQFTVSDLHETNFILYIRTIYLIII
jgi:hypothetical protein